MKLLASKLYSHDNKFCSLWVQFSHILCKLINLAHILQLCNADLDLKNWKEQVNILSSVVCKLFPLPTWLSLAHLSKDSLLKHKIIKQSLYCFVFRNQGLYWQPSSDLTSIRYSFTSLWWVNMENDQRLRPKQMLHLEQCKVVLGQAWSELPIQNNAKIMFHVNNHSSSSKVPNAWANEGGKMLAFGIHISSGWIERPICARTTGISNGSEMTTSVTEALHLRLRKFSIQTSRAQQLRYYRIDSVKRSLSALCGPNTASKNQIRLRLSIPNCNIVTLPSEVNDSMKRNLW